MTRMDRTDDFALTVSAWLHEDARHHAPDDLDAVLRRTRTERQRPAWSSPERWLPMDITASRTAFNRPAYVRGLALLIVLALLIAAIVAVSIGSRQRLPPPFGLAQNGAVIASADGDILAVDPKTGKTSPLIADGSFDFGPAFSRDGTKFLFLRDPDGPDVDTGLSIVVANADGGGARQVTPLVIGPRLVRLVARWRADRFPVATKGRRHGGRDQRRERRRNGAPSPRRGQTGLLPLMASAGWQGDRLPRRASPRGGSATGDLGRAPGWNRASPGVDQVACQRR